MLCQKCNSPVDDSGFCTVCGAYNTAVNEKPIPNAQNDITYAQYNEAPATDPGKTFGTVSFVLGIVAISLGTICSCLAACLGGVLPFICAVVSIVLGIIANNKSKAAGFKNSKATVGIILSAVSIVVIIIFIILNAVLGAAFSEYLYNF